MASKSRIKGNYHERWFVKWLQAMVFKSERQPLIGSLGGEYSGDIIWEFRGLRLVVEIKYRDKSSFPNPFKVLEGRDIAMYKRRTGTPQTIVIIDGTVFEEQIAPLLKEN